LSAAFRRAPESNIAANNALIVFPVMVLGMGLTL